MTVLRLPAVAVFLCLALCRNCYGQVLTYCPGTVEVTENSERGSVRVCVSYDISNEADQFGNIVTWNVATIDGSATAGTDYQSTRTTLQDEPPPLALASLVCVNVPIIDDTEYEGREEFSVVFTLDTTGDTCTSQVEITDFEDLEDCFPPTVMNVMESVGMAEVCSTLTGNILGGFAVETGSATGGGVDYSVSSDLSTTINVDGLESCVIVNITDDSETENTEMFAIRFMQGFNDGRTPCAVTVQVNILDNDGDSTTRSRRPTEMPIETTTSPTLPEFYCSEEEHVFLTEGGNLASPVIVCMSFPSNGEVPQVERIAIVTEDGEQSIFSPEIVKVDPGEICVEVADEIEDIPVPTPEFYVIFHLVDPQANVQCPVSIVDKGEGPSIECEELYYGVRENGSVGICGMINNTSEELPLSGMVIATLMNEDGAELAGEMYELQMVSPQKYCTELSIEDDLIPEPPTSYTIKLEWGGPTPNIVPQPGSCDLVVVDDDDFYSLCGPDPPPFPLSSFLFVNYNTFPFCLATLDVEPVLSNECGQTERSCSILSTANIDISGHQIRERFGRDLEMDCVEEILFFVQDLYPVNISTPPEEACMTDCALYAGGVDDCSEGILVLHNMDGLSALDTESEFVLENCPSDLVFHFSCCQSEVSNSCREGSSEPPTPQSSEEEGESGLYIGIAVSGVVCILVTTSTILIVAVVCVRRRKNHVQSTMMETEFADMDKNTLKKKAIDTKMNVAYVTSRNPFCTNENIAYGVTATSGHNEPEYDYPQTQDLTYDYPRV